MRRRQHSAGRGQTALGEVFGSLLNAEFGAQLCGVELQGLLYARHGLRHAHTRQTCRRAVRRHRLAALAFEGGRGLDIVGARSCEFEQIQVSVQRLAAHRNQLNVFLDGQDHVAVGVRVLVVEDQNIRQIALGDLAQALAPAHGIGGFSRHHLDQFPVGKKAPQCMSVDQVCHLEFAQARFASRRRPVWRQADRQARSARRLYVGGLAVQHEVGQWRPDQLGACAGHFLELRLGQADAMDRDQFGAEQIAVLDRIEFSGHALRGTLGQMDHQWALSALCQHIGPLLGAASNVNPAGR